ncbi:MAG: NAD(P)/FAD-dependent oxidoreductase [Defluviitaleaceae bacterium]|nr:NAD(P)/FAD-dependent oxidoreductase [Defluviitaleaceae bacterium]
MKADIIIIGAGIVGCATARFLSQYKLKIIVLERGADVAIGATKANSGILHSGYDCEPNTHKAALNVKGLSMYHKLKKELDIPMRICGSMVVSFSESGEKSPELIRLYERGISNGVTDMELISGEVARKLEPNLHLSVTGALVSKNAGIISPYEAAIAFAENAAENGVEFFLNTNVTHINFADKSFTIHTSTGYFSSPVVINAAGLESGNIHNMTHVEKESIIPQRGEYYLLDNTQRNLVSRTIFQLPTNLGKGVLITPTLDHNILLGPTGDFIDEGNSTETTLKGLAETLEKASLSLNKIPIRHRITNFAGVRAKHHSRDFVIEESTSGFFNAIGIDSPGLTAAPAIAKMLGEMVLSRLQPKENPKFKSKRVGIKRFKELSPTLQAEYIAQNPAYGRIVCRCETITEGEIIESIRRPVGAKNLDAVKRRSRAQMGRCQGGFCTMRLMEILSAELGISELEITKSGAGSEIVHGSF